MPNGYLIVQQGGYADRAAEIPPEGLLIGRGDDVGLRLSNVSVSRHHARITVDGKRTFLEDLGSGNGTLINQKAVQSQTPIELANEAIIQIGSFKLIFLAKVGRSFPSWKGTFAHQMPKYSATARPQQEDMTFGLDKATLIRMAEADHRCTHARIIEQGPMGRTWTPGDRELVFGKKNQVHVPGWLIASQAARIVWLDGHHVIESQSWWTRTSLNGQPLSSPTRLHNGARLRIGKSLFRYDVPAADHIRKMYDEPQKSKGGRRETFTLPKKD